MSKVFINLSNHPSTNWSIKQTEAAKYYGEIVDIDFPLIRAEADETEIEELAEQYLERILEHDCRAVMVQGEFTFTYHFIKLLEKKQITALAACTERKSEEAVNPDGSTTKKVNFQFVRFRKYT